MAQKLPWTGATFCFSPRQFEPGLGQQMLRRSKIFIASFNSWLSRSTAGSRQTTRRACFRTGSYAKMHLTFLTRWSGLNSARC